MSRAKRLLVEFEDGTQQGVDVGQLSREGWVELARLGLVRLHAPSQAPAHYALLEWEGGWKEAVAVDSDVLGVLRYYTVERVEELGRLALERPNDYPQLILVNRLPRKVKSLLLTGKSGLTVYTFEGKSTVKEGGKAEHILYDAKDGKVVKEDGTGPRTAGLKASVRDELKKKGLDASQVLSMDDERKAEAYDGLARSLGIRAMERQADVYGFLQHILEGL